MPWIDLNVDCGESFGPWKLGLDEAVLPLVTSANVACGFHAGDPTTMRATVARAKAHGVAVGAHPGYPDLLGFGRRAMDASPAEVRDYVTYQVGALQAVARAQGVALQHVKPHGALYNRAVVDRALALAICEAVADCAPEAYLLAPEGSAMADAARATGLRLAREGFADRGYEPDGRLVDRRRPGAVLDDPEVVARRAVRIAREGRVDARDGTDLALPCDSLCVHGDNPAAVALVRALRTALEAAGIGVRPFGLTLGGGGG